MKYRKPKDNEIVHHTGGSFSDKKIIIPLTVLLLFVVIISFFLIKTVFTRQKTTTANVQTTVQIPQTVITENTTSSKAENTEKTVIKPDGEGLVFAKGSYYLEGTLYTNTSSEGINVSVAVKNSDTEITSLYKQMWLGVMNLNGNKYIVDLSSKSYIDYTDEALSKISVSSFDFDVSLPGDISNLTFNKTNATIDNEKGVIYTATDNNYGYQIITVNSELKQITVTDNTDKSKNYCIIVTVITSEIPADRLTFTDYAKSTSTFSFFSAITN